MLKRGTPVTIGDKLRKKRVEKGLSQYQLAQQSGLRPEVISRLETGRSGASLASLHKLAPILGFSIDEMVRDQQLATTKQKGKTK